MLCAGKLLLISPRRLGLYLDPSVFGAAISDTHAHVSGGTCNRIKQLHASDQHASVILGLLRFALWVQQAPQDRCTDT